MEYAVDGGKVVGNRDTSWRTEYSVPQYQYCSGRWPFPRSPPILGPTLLVLKDTHAPCFPHGDRWQTLSTLPYLTLPYLTCLPCLTLPCYGPPPPPPPPPPLTTEYSLLNLYLSLYGVPRPHLTRLVLLPCVHLDLTPSSSVNPSLQKPSPSHRGQALIRRAPSPYTEAIHTSARTDATPLRVNTPTLTFVHRNIRPDSNIRSRVLERASRIPDQERGPY